MYVGRIDLLPAYSLFDVRKADAHRVVSALKILEFFGKRVYSEIADPDRDYASAGKSGRKSKKRQYTAAPMSYVYAVVVFFRDKCVANIRNNLHVTKKKRFIAPLSINVSDKTATAKWWKAKA